MGFLDRIDKEKEIITLMINLYCKKKHGSLNNEVCSGCRDLEEYAHKRLTYCKFGNEKSSCKKCAIHCYKKDMREKVKEVMKFSGPRILIYNPLEYIKHIFK